MPDLFSYTDYARFIKDFYEEKKRANKAFSYAAFAKKAGFKTRSYLIEVAAGKKELSRASLYSVAKAMDLGPKETEYFEALVGFQHAGTFKEREFHFRKLESLAGKAPGRLLEESQFAYFSAWYHPVVRELVCMPRFDGDLGKLARSLQPAITGRQAKESVELLLKLGLLVKTPAGKFRQADGAVRTGDGLKSFLILKYQKENLRLADEALDAVDPEVRDISTFTAGVSPACFATLRKELQAFRAHLANLVDKDQGQDRVYQLNLQLFPVSSHPHGEKEHVA